MNMNLRPKRRPVPQIPIVSLIDIMVVLLIFFIATTTFRQTKTQMQIALPESKGMGKSAPLEDLRVAITVTKEQRIFLDGTELALDKLAAGLRTLRAQNPKVRLELEADTATQLGILVQVWDALREVGIPITDVPARIQRQD